MYEAIKINKQINKVEIKATKISNGYELPTQYLDLVVLTKITLEGITEFLKIILKRGKFVKFFKRDELAESSQKTKNGGALIKDRQACSPLCLTSSSGQSWSVKYTEEEAAQLGKDASIMIHKQCMRYYTMNPKAYQVAYCLTDIHF